MIKTSKSKVNRWFDDNYAKNLANLAMDLIIVHKGKGKMAGLFHPYADLKNIGQYNRIKCRNHKGLADESREVKKYKVNFLLEEVVVKIYDTRSNTKEIKYLPVYQWLLYRLATLVYEGVTGKSFNDDPDENFKLLMQVSKKKVDKFIDVVAELFVGVTLPIQRTGSMNWVTKWRKPS